MAYYINTLYNFLSQLAENNDREWFKARKPLYEELRAQWLSDLERMISVMSEWEPSLAHLDPRRCAYRIYRDTRFSPDKRPFKTYFSASVNPDSSPGAHHVGYYLQAGPSFDDDYGTSGLYAGIWCPETPVLNKLRHAIVDNIEEWDGIVKDRSVTDNFDIVSSGQLKTAPKGWPKDHPQIQWLRMRDFGLNSHVGSEFFLDPEWPVKAAGLFRIAKPFVDFLSYSVNE